MSDENKGTTVFLDAETITKADAVAGALGVLVGGKMSRSAVARRAIHDLFLAVCLTDKTGDTPVSIPAEPIEA